MVWDLHHEGARLVSNLGIILRVIFIHLCGLKLINCGHARCREFKERKKSLIKINLGMSVWKTWYIKMHEYNL
jgi:hypothetical protein